MKTLSELIESSGHILKDHLHTLVPCLLKATGELEGAKMSYLSTRLGANAEAQEAVDSIRAEAAKQHHSMETLVKVWKEELDIDTLTTKSQFSFDSLQCIRHISYESLEKMTPQIVELMKTTMNLGTKISCAHFICLVCRHIPPLLNRIVFVTEICFSFCFVRSPYDSTTK